MIPSISMTLLPTIWMFNSRTFSIFLSLSPHLLPAKSKVRGLDSLSDRNLNSISGKSTSLGLLRSGLNFKWSFMPVSFLKSLSILDGIGGASIGSEALKALAEGFQNRKGNAIVTIGEGNIDIISNLKKVRVKKLVKMKLSNLTKNFTFWMLMIYWKIKFSRRKFIWARIIFHF